MFGYHDQLTRMEAKLRSLMRIAIFSADKLEKIMAQIDDLEAELARNTSVDQSVLALITDLLAQVEAAKTDPVRIQAVIDKFRANDDSLAAAVAANTPAAPAP